MLRRLPTTFAEALCPLMIVWATLTDLRTVRWPAYGGRDVEIYAVIAWFWRDGLLPYRDLYDFKPPLMYAALRAAWALWGPGAESLRCMLMLLAAAGAIVAYVGLRRAGQGLAATLTALGFLTLVVADPWHIVSQNTELLAVPFAIAAFGCAAAYQAGGRWPWAVASGVGVGVATLAKQPAVLWLAAVAVQAGLRRCAGGVRDEHRHRWLALVGRMLLVAIGAALPIGLTVLYFAWHGAAADLLQATVTDGMRYAGLATRPPRQVLLGPTSGLLVQVAQQPAMWPFVGAVFALPLVTLLYPSRLLPGVWAWVAVSYVVVVVGPRTEWHYLMCAFPALALTFGAVVERAVGPRDTGPPSARRAVGAVLLSVLAFGSAWRGPLPPPGAAGRASAVAALAAKIREARQPGDTLFVRDEPYLLYVETDMRPPTRIIYGDAPQPGAADTWARALEQQPTFVFISHGTDSRLPTAQVGFEATLAQLFARAYDRWLVDPIGVVYKRR